MIHLAARSPIGFANELEKVRYEVRSDVLMSLERVRRCDIYRAGDGAHLAWLNRREKFEPVWRRVARKFNHKHRNLLWLEEELFHERGAERVIANSRMVKDEIVDLYNYRRDRIDVIYNGIPFEQFGYKSGLRSKSRSEIGFGSDEIAVLFAGTGWERKGLQYAIDAVEECDNPKIRLVVAGRGDQASYRSNRAIFLGELPDLRPSYAAADIFILPTIYDPFSNACLEAIASGLPVITTRANGFSEIMEDRIHGSIVDTADDVSDLAEAIEDWSDPTRRNAARPNILKRASQFDISRNVEQTLGVLLHFAASAESTSGKISNT
jgi:UDP-glucose:(heptosyl)LPS alpha-1,3-glucosyltransferase